MSSRLAVWDMYFVGVVSMRLHPRNCPALGDHPEFVLGVIGQSAKVADLMMVEHDRRDGRAYAERRE